MEYFYIATALVTFAAIFGYINVRFIKLPNTIGLMLVSIVFTFCVMVLSHINPTLLNVEKYKYTTYIIPITYDKMLPIYFNNQSKFLDTYYNQNLLHNTTMYEKKEIRWFSFSELKKKRFMFRNFYREMIDLILENKRKVERLFGLQTISVKKSKKIKRNNRKKTKKLNVTIKPSKTSTMKVFKLF